MARRREQSSRKTQPPRWLIIEGTRPRPSRRLLLPRHLLTARPQILIANPRSNSLKTHNIDTV